MNIKYCWHLLLFIYLFVPLQVFALCVNVEKANLRKGPGTSYEKTWEVFKYMPLRYLSKKGSWYRVKDVDGETHWVHSKLLTGKVKCAVIKAEKANLRIGPGSKYRQAPSYPTAEKYTTFKFLERKGKWVKVLDSYNDIYWVHTNLVWVQ